MNIIKKMIPIFIGSIIGAISLKFFMMASITGKNEFMFMIPVLIILYVGFLFIWKKRKDLE